jgi:indole-3-glycerol phosphate synthase
MSQAPDTARPDVLRAIVAATRRIVETRRAATPLRALEEAYEDRLLGTQSRQRYRPLEVALSRPGRFNVIAECKRRSPSKGVLRGDYDPAAIARTYATNGAQAISVLTEPTFFDGALEHLDAVDRELAQASLPLLRKDFIVDEYQILEASVHGATAILLIVAALSDVELGALLRSAGDRDLDVLVEVHDRDELERALNAGASCIGVNNRSLQTLDVSLETSFDLIDRIPDECVAVAESGLRTGDDLARLRRAGFDAFLIGERFMTETDPGAALAGLLESADRAWEVSP